MVARSSSLQQQQQAHAAAGEQGGGGLLSSCAATRLKAVRELKNQLIGNKFKKLQHLHLVPLLLELVAGSASSSNSTTSDDSATNAAELQVQAISTLGSLAYGVEDGVRAIVAANGVQAIVSALGASDQRVVVAAARSLKLVYQVGFVCAGGSCGCSVVKRVVACDRRQIASGMERCKHVWGWGGRKGCVHWWLQRRRGMHRLGRRSCLVLS